MAEVTKGIVVQDLFELEGNSILPEGIAIIVVEFKGFSVGTWDFDPKFVTNLFRIGTLFSIIDSDIDKTLSLGCPLEEAPSRGVEEAVFMGIHSHCDGVKFGDLVKWFPSSATVIPMDINIP